MTREMGMRDGRRIKRRRAWRGINGLLLCWKFKGRRQRQSQQHAWKEKGCQTFARLGWFYKKDNLESVVEEVLGKG